MLSLLNNTNFFSNYGLLIVLGSALVILMLISFGRRKKEDTYRAELEDKIVPGVKIKTYFGLYGKVLKIQETTDGKVVLIQTGEGDKVSYQTIHIRAIYSLDEKEDVTLDENGNPVKTETKSESEKKFEELEKQLEAIDNKKVEEEKVEEKVEENSSEKKFEELEKQLDELNETSKEEKEEPKKVEVEKKEVKKPATKKATTSKTTGAKKASTTKKTTSKKASTAKTESKKED